MSTEGLARRRASHLIIYSSDVENQFEEPKPNFDDLPPSSPPQYSSDGELTPLGANDPYEFTSEDVPLLELMKQGAHRESSPVSDFPTPLQRLTSCAGTFELLDKGSSICIIDSSAVAYPFIAESIQGRR